MNYGAFEAREACAAYDASFWNDERGFLFDVVDRSEPAEVPHDLPIAQRIAGAMDVPLEVAGMPSWTDAGNLLHHHGLGCVIFGAGDLAAEHSNHEWVSVPDLERLTTVLRTVLRNGGTAR